jgi:hypothetical protein
MIHQVLFIGSGRGYSRAMSSLAPETAPTPFRAYVTPYGYRVALYRTALAAVPADFFADPDGKWTFELLADAAGFDRSAGVAVGALRERFGEHREGAAVVTLNSEARPHVAIVECPIAYEYVGDAERAQSSAA